MAGYTGQLRDLPARTASGLADAHYPDWPGSAGNIWWVRAYRIHFRSKEIPAGARQVGQLDICSTQARPGSGDSRN